MKQDQFTPQPEDRFTFGLWTVGNRGRDPFGEETRPGISPVEIVHKLSELGAMGVNLHDNDLVPIDCSAQERDRIVNDFKKALADTGMRCQMATTNLFYDQVFKDGAYTSSDPNVRAYALQKTMKAMDLGVELGASIYVFWGGREGAETEAGHPFTDAIKWYRECMNYLCEYVRDQNYDLKFAMEPKPNEPRGDIYLATVGATLAFIETLDHPEMVGVNPEVAHETMAGLSMTHAVSQALDRGKLFHIDLNAQKIGRYDQDLRFASEDLKGNFWLVHTLEQGYEGPLHFDAHAYRTEDQAGVWDFALGCMRTYNILRAKAKQFNQHSEVQDILKSLDQKLQPEIEGCLGSYSPAKKDKLMAHAFDRPALAERKLQYERLDQLATEILLGVA